jgi:hypothetical protein
MVDERGRLMHTFDVHGEAVVKKVARRPVMTCAILLALALTSACSLVIDTDRSFREPAHIGSDPSSGDAGGQTGVSCEEGAKDCLDRVPRRCRDGKIVAEAECSGLTPFCLGGNCVACTPGVSICDDNDVLFNCSNEGQKVDGARCSTDRPECVDGVCRECAPNTTRCKDFKLSHCTEPGTWGPESRCPERQRCSDNVCVHDEPPTLTIDSPKDGAVFQPVATGSSRPRASVTLTGSAPDREDSNLSTQIRWFVSLNNDRNRILQYPRGDAAQITLELLDNCYPGTSYFIRATVQDSAGTEVDQTVTITIAAPIC